MRMLPDATAAVDLVYRLKESLPANLDRLNGIE